MRSQLAHDLFDWNHDLVFFAHAKCACGAWLRGRGVRAEPQSRPEARPFKMTALKCTPGANDEAKRYCERSLGSSASRTESPNKLKPKTASVIATPGQMATHGALSAYSSAPPCSINPQAGVGSCTPRPR